MAFLNSGLKHECGKCSGDLTDHKLCESRRASAVNERDGEPRSWRVCADCELSLRIAEWDSWNEEMRQYRGAEHATEERVFRDFKRADEGKVRYWRGAGALLQAKEVNAERKEGREEVPNSKKRKQTINRSKEIARAPLKAPITGQLIPALGDAGHEMHMSTETHEERGGLQRLREGRP